MKNFLKKCFSNQQGFSVIDLLVASTIIAIVFSFVLANFRTGQRRGELDGVLKQIISGITTVRNMNLGGQLITNPSPPYDEIFPAGGYAVRFDDVPSPAPDRFVLYAVFTPGTPYSSGDEIANGVKQLNDVEFIGFCGLTALEVNDNPCEGAWNPMAPPINPLEVIFSQPNTIIGFPSQDDSDPVEDFKYLGGKIRHLKTNREAYFYISLISGIVVGKIL